MLSLIPFFNNYYINQNATIIRAECERNVCLNELQRLRYGLNKLMNFNNRYLSCCRRRNSRNNNEFQSSLFRIDGNFSQSRNSENLNHKSLLYMILEAKILDCLRNNQKFEKTSSKSLSILSSPISISNINPTETKSTSILNVDDYEKSRLAVPESKLSKSKKSKKRKKKKLISS